MDDRQSKVARLRKKVGGRLPTRQVKHALVLAGEEATRMGSQYIGTEHLLLGLLLEREGLAGLVLEIQGVDLARVRDEIERLMQNETTA